MVFLALLKGGKVHSFTVKLDDSEIWPQIEAGMKEFPPNVPMPRDARPAHGTIPKKPTTGNGKPNENSNKDNAARPGTSG